MNTSVSLDYNPGDYIPAALQASSGGKGRAGNISLSATGSINLIGQDSNQQADLISTFFIQSSIPGGADITLKANGSISLKNAYLVSDRGNGSGNISLFGKESVSITDNSFLNAGTIQHNSGNITVKSKGRVFIDRSSLGIDVGANGTGNGDSFPGNAGDINISGRSIFITGGSLLESSSEAGGINSGNISLSATDRIEVSGYDQFYMPECCTGNRNRPFLYTSLRANNSPKSLGRSGEINVNTPILRVSDGAILRADTQNAFKEGGNINVNANVVELRSGGQLLTNASSTGDAGNIKLQNTQRLVIDGTNPSFDKFYEIAQAFVPVNDQSAKYQLGTTSRLSGIFANTTSSQGGNITIGSPKLLLLRRNAQISATAEGNGSGGNITINAPSGFIVAVPNENSYITANADKGSGGRVQINATGIYGLKVLIREDLVRLFGSDLTQLDFQQLPSSITAISQTSPSLNGQVNLNTNDLDPSRGLVQLPAAVIDTPRLISSGCAAASDNSFTITGRGGLPPSPSEPLSSDVVWTDTRLPATMVQQHQHKTHASLPKPEPIVVIPATGWVFNNKGEVTLISRATNVTSVNTPFSCPAH